MPLTPSQPNFLIFKTVTLSGSWKPGGEQCSVAFKYRMSKEKKNALVRLIFIAQSCWTGISLKSLKLLQDDSSETRIGTEHFTHIPKYHNELPVHTLISVLIYNFERSHCFKILWDEVVFRIIVRVCQINGQKYWMGDRNLQYTVLVGKVHDH